VTGVSAVVCAEVCGVAMCIAQTQCTSASSIMCVCACLAYTRAALPETKPHLPSAVALISSRHCIVSGRAQPAASDVYTSCVAKKRIRRWRFCLFGPRTRPIFSPQPNHGGPRGVRSQGSRLGLKPLYIALNIEIKVTKK
jgi:hypothetical protein